MHSTNLLSPHKGSEEYARFATWMLFGVTATAIVASIFLSPLKVIGLLVMFLTCYVAFLRPDILLAFLLFYLPFESFILKFISDDIYLYARYYSEIIVYLLCAVVIWRLLTGQFRWRFTQGDLPFAIFAFVLLASSAINANPAFVSLLGARQIIRFILLYFVAVQLRLSAKWVKVVIVGLLAILGVQVILGLGQVVVGERLDTLLLPGERKTFGEIELTQGTDYFWDPGQRVFGTLGRYDRLGAFMMPLMLFLVAFLYEARKKKEMITRATVLLVASLPVLALTYSRASWFSFVMGAIFISLFAHRDKRILYGVLIGVGILVAYALLSGLVVSRLIDLPSQSLIHRLFEAFSLERWYGEYYGLGRVYWIVQTLLVVLPASIIFGHGPGTFGGGAVSAMQYTEVYDNLGLPFGVFGTQGMIDNNWMSLLGETGLLGMGLYIWMYAGIILLLWHGLKKVKDATLRAFVLATIASMIGIAFISFLGTYLEVRTVAAYLWVFAGISIALVTYPPQQTAEESI